MPADLFSFNSLTFKCVCCIAEVINAIGINYYSFIPYRARALLCKIEIAS